jgi:flagellar basal body-associated protein FliL
MFEAQTKEKSGGSGLLIGICIVVVLAVVGTLAYMNKGSAKGSEGSSSAATGAAPAQQLKGDPVKDLHIVSYKMEKDYTGNLAVWSVDIRNQSQVYTYSNISYQTNYFGGDNSALVQNKGSVSLSLAPGDEQSTQFRDVLYPDKTAWYRFTVVGADASK